MIKINYATLNDYNYLKKDKLINNKILKEKIKSNEIIIIKLNHEPIGWLRFNYFWDNIPFMNLIMIEKEYRNQGNGKKIINHWEKEMKQKGHIMTMTSTLSDEVAQHFYRKVGYKDCGSLLIKKEPLEIIFIKYIK